MDVQGGVDGIKSSQQALLDLERSKVPPVELLDAVAQILRVNYSHIRSTIFDPELSKEIPRPAASCMPKEEWVLRWLLKRVGLSRSGGKSKISNEGCLRYDHDTDVIFGSTYDENSMRLDGRSWLLFLYLVYHVSCQALARILIEADFITHLDACLRDGEHALGLVPAEPVGQEYAVSFSESPSKGKKRKISPSKDDQTKPNDQRPPPETFPALLVASICAAIKHCVEISRKPVDEVSSEHIKLALSSPPGVAASVTSRLVSSFVAIVSQGTRAPLDRSILVAHAPGLFGLWEYRTEEDANPSNGESSQKFMAHCLSPWLAFLKWLRTSDLATGNDHILRKTERLIVLHSVLPARAEFASTCNLPAAPKTMDTAPSMPILESFSRIADALLPLLYDIAARSIPRNTLRMRQREQPWLEALFSKLATSCGDDSLQELLAVALTHDIALPQKELAQIAFRQFSQAKPQWPVLVDILQIDASVFLSSPLPLMERLCDSIADLGVEEYALIRDSVIVPLMRAAARIRKLQDLVNIWQHSLAENMQERTISRFWEAPELFAAFTDLARTEATPAFVHNLLQMSFEHIKKFATGEGAMSTALAWTAIVGSVITSRAEDCVAEASILRQLLEASSAAITHAPGPELQRWRLWRLVRQILTILPDEDDPNGLLAINTGGHSPYVFLGTWLSADDKSLEIIECFHLLMCRTVAQPSGYNELLQREFKSLAHLLNNFGDPSNVASSSGLANACLGIILQNAQVLLLQPTENLWPALWRYATASGSTTSQRLFEALVASDVVTSSHSLLSQCFQAIHDSIVSSERHQSDFAYKILLAMPCRNIKRSQERTKLVKLLEDGGVTPRDGEVPPARSSKLEDPLFQEFKYLYSSSSTTTRHGRRLPILEADSFERLCLELDYARLTLDTPNQYIVDDLLSTLTSLTSPASLKFDSMPTSGPSAIYQRLCSLTSILLTRFRKRLGGRYHLLLPVFQGLLRCLFRPIPIPASSKQPQIRHHQPPWLLISTTEPLTSKSATQYTRLLTSLCDPTASSVSSSRHRTPLTDDTKKAKSMAGQYMQYLVMEYARCQLQGQLPAEVKTALMPGLYAVLDVMPRDLMRGMNAAMDSSSRAIFKGLYEDYQHFGRWNQS
jgi:hypothetical protein